VSVSDAATGYPRSVGGHNGTAGDRSRRHLSAGARDHAYVSGGRRRQADPYTSAGKRHLRLALEVRAFRMRTSSIYSHPCSGWSRDGMWRAVTSAPAWGSRSRRCRDVPQLGPRPHHGARPVLPYTFQPAILPESVGAATYFTLFALTYPATATPRAPQCACARAALYYRSHGLGRRFLDNSQTRSSSRCSIHGSTSSRANACCWAGVRRRRSS